MIGTNNQSSIDSYSKYVNKLSTTL